MFQRCTIKNECPPNKERTVTTVGYSAFSPASFVKVLMLNNKNTTFGGLENASKETHDHAWSLGRGKLRKINFLRGKHDLIWTRDGVRRESCVMCHAAIVVSPPPYVVSQGTNAKIRCVFFDNKPERASSPVSDMSFVDL